MVDPCYWEITKLGNLLRKRYDYAPWEMKQILKQIKEGAGLEGLKKMLQIDIQRYWLRGQFELDSLMPGRK